jgi:predicted TIM-barrel fold metal-dependent hydrolase
VIETRRAPSFLTRASGNLACSSPVATLLPDPAPRHRYVPVVSVDDHLIEPADLFTDRLPARLAAAAPRVVTDDDGSEAWEFDGQRHPQVGLNAVAGRPRDEWSLEPTRFDEMRRGCWDPAARADDMDIDGVAASLCFPSLIAGFAGTVFSRTHDPELGLACVRAWNDWHIDGWCAGAPDRLIPLQVAWLNDPKTAAADVRANAARGFRALSFPENPADLGLPSVHDRHWDPLLAACEETQTVVCLHNGSSAWTSSRSPGAPLELLTTLFPVNALVACADWLWAGIPWRFPALQIAFSEGGIGWVPMLMDRIEWVLDHSAAGLDAWRGADITPVEAMQRNFWYCAIDPGSVVPLRERIGVDRILVESDYPHADSTWPDTQANLASAFAGVPADEVAAMCWRNACGLFRWELPAGWDAA